MSKSLNFWELPFPHLWKIEVGHAKILQKAKQIYLHYSFGRQEASRSLIKKGDRQLWDFNKKPDTLPQNNFHKDKTLYIVSESLMTLWSGPRNTYYKFLFCKFIQNSVNWGHVTKFGGGKSTLYLNLLGFFLANEIYFKFQVLAKRNQLLLWLSKRNLVLKNWKRLA